MLFTPVTELYPVPPIRWDLFSDNDMTRRIRSILQRWVPFAGEQFREWDDKPNAGHFFGGHFWYCSDTASTSLVFAVLAKLGDYDADVAGIPRDELKRMAIAGLRYAGFTHDTGPADCVRVEGPLPYTSRKKWGGQGDNFFMASQNGRSIASIGHAAWLLWEELDEETKRLVQNMVISYADRWSDEEPRNGAYYDTQCEENAWTSMGIAAAVAMLPDHPHHAEWKRGFMQWSISSVTTFRDRLADPSGLIDTPAGNRVKTVTFHPDMTTENHAFVHPSYLCAGTNLRALHATFSLLGGQPILDSALHNNVTLFERTVRVWAQFDGLAVPVQGQDWWYNRQHERQLTHAVLNVLHGHSDAALLESAALDSIERLQASNGRGCLLEERGEECVLNAAHAQYAKDLEPGSALDLTTSYLLHAFGGAGAEPSDPAEFRARMEGVYEYPYGCIIVHRTRDSFTSFSWRNNVMALSLPSHGLWTVTPLYASYTGTMTFEEAKGVKGLTNEAIIRDVERSRITTGRDGFGAAVTIARGDRELLQDVGFVALPSGASVYMERFRVLKPCRVKDMGTGLIGIRNDAYPAMPELAPGVRTLYLPDRQERFRGFYGQEPNGVHDYDAAPYVNVDDRMGYLLYGSRAVRYLNKHEYPKWKGVEDILTLNHWGDRSFTDPEALEPFIVVSLPNRTWEQTQAAYREAVRLVNADAQDVLMVELEGAIAFANLGDEKRIVCADKSAAAGGAELAVYEGTTRVTARQWSWRQEIGPFTAGFWEARYMLEPLDAAADIELSLHGSRLHVLNRGGAPVAVRLRAAAGRAAAWIRLELPAYGHRTYDPDPREE